jgi:hypothetical protein
MWIWLGPLVGVLGIGCLFAMFAYVRFCARAADAGGVRAANEVPAEALARLERDKVLATGETLIAYYDATIAGDGSEVAMVTSDRLVYVNGGRTTALKLVEIADVQHHTESLLGDIIEARDDSGATLRVVVAPLNGGDFFVSSLQDAWKKKRPSAKASASPSSPSPSR